MTEQGCVYLVGAGCGKADLITLRGLNRLKNCDAVIYDDLIDPLLLDIVSEHAERIYMGKRSGNYYAPQAEINAAIIAKAREGKRVVRLKGGDPFVFGRGGEEIEALQAAGIPYEEVPGISSAIAIPAAAGIPVTHRGLSRSFHVITAHTATTADGLPENIEKLATLEGTLVFLMGLSRLDKLAKRLIDGGLDASTPSAVISGGNSPNPALVRAPLARLAEESEAAGMRSPAIILVGATAALDFSPALRLPLDGVCVALTGTDAVTSKLTESLFALGADVYAAQRSAVVELGGDFDMAELSRRPGVITFTSSNGVRLFFKRLRTQGVDIRALAECRFAVIGAATGEVLAEYGINADICPEEFTSAALGETLLRKTRENDMIYLFRSALGSKPLYDKLSKCRKVKDIHVYTLQSEKSVAERAKARLERTDYICFSSSSGVKLFLSEHGRIPDEAKCVCIGDITARELAKNYDKPFIRAKEISAESIVEAILSDK